MEKRSTEKPAQAGFSAIMGTMVSAYALNTATTRILAELTENEDAVLFLKWEETDDRDLVGRIITGRHARRNEPLNYYVLSDVTVWSGKDVSGMISYGAEEIYPTLEDAMRNL